jgi:toxin-antitoxin system PIN domain toxin
LARRALEDGYGAARGVGFAWTALLAFIRLSTRRGIFPKPLSIDDAIRVVKHWLDNPQAQIVEPGERHLDIVAGLLRSAGTAGNLTSDAHLAALAIEHDAVIVSFDRDFARFADVRWTHPA